MNRGLEAQGRANLQDSGRLTLAYRKEPKMTDETGKGGGRQRKKKSSFNHADHSFDELKLIINFQLLWLYSGHVVVCTAILPLP